MIQHDYNIVFYSFETLKYICYHICTESLVFNDGWSVGKWPFSVSGQ